VTLVCSFLPVSCKIAITIFDTITIRYPTTSDCFYHNVLLSMPYHVEMLLPKRSSLHFFVSISSIQILHTNSNKLQTKSRSFIDYNDQSNNPKCTVYLYGSLLLFVCSICILEMDTKKCRLDLLGNNISTWYGMDSNTLW
jgi:hypothetical protein